MLILLPIVTFWATFLLLLAAQSTKPAPHPKRLAFMQASVLLGAFIALSAEVLSLFNALSQLGFALAWLAALVASVGVGLRKNQIARGARDLLQTLRRLRAFELVASAMIAIIVGMLFVVATLSPPNNTDSLLYHMSRVVHWVQNQSLRHYATGFAPQLLNPIGAEVAIAHLRGLWGNDQLANLVQWFSMIGCLVGVSLLTRLLGGGSRGQLAATAFALSIPMGLMQATSTQNDYVVAFWLICMLCFTTLGALRPLTKDEVLCFSLALALGLWTKGTFYPYAVPVAIWYGVLHLRRHGLRTSIPHGIALAVPVIALNLGYWLRNTSTFGGPLGSADWVSNMTSSHSGPLSWIAAIARDLAMHFVTPFEAWNERIVDGLRSVFSAYDPYLAGYSLTWGWNHEDWAANPLHVVLVGLVLLVLILRPRIRDRLTLQFTLVVGALFLTQTLVVKFDPWGIRYQLPHWVAWAPVVGVVVSRLGKRRLAPAFTMALLLSSLPWAVLNLTRPILGMRDVRERLTIPCEWRLGCSIGSILLEPKTTILFANWTPLRGPYIAMSEDLLRSNCRRVGLRIDSHDPEYLFWWLLSAPQSGIRIESVYPVPELQFLLDREFEPCAVICTICGDRTQLHGMPLVGDYGPVKLFSGTAYSPSP